MTGDEWSHRHEVIILYESMISAAVTCSLLTTYFYLLCFTSSLMFLGAQSLNQPLNDWQPVSVKTTQEIFTCAFAFNQDLSSWGGSTLQNVVDMSSMFASARLFDSPIDTWDVSNCLDFTGMFQSATDFNQPLSNWFLKSEAGAEIVMSWYVLQYSYFRLQSCMPPHNYFPSSGCFWFFYFQPGT